MKINTTGDLLTSIARGWPSSARSSLARFTSALVDFRKEKNICVQVWEVPEDSRGVSGMFGGGGGYCGVFRVLDLSPFPT